jgi:hypothetical protein
MASESSAASAVGSAPDHHSTESACGSDLVLMDIDPMHAHAYWNITPVDFQTASEASAASALTLRIYTLSAHAAPVDYEVSGLANHHTIDFWQSGQAYRAEIGVRSESGKMSVIATSNEIRTPSGKKAPAVAQTKQAEVSPMSLETSPHPAESPMLGAREFPIPRELDAPSPIAFDEQAAHIAQAHREAAQSEPVFESTPAPLPDENYVDLSSGGPAGGDNFLEVNAEIHVYGRAKPGSILHFQGQRVVTAPDGRFSLRKPLPKGALVLPLMFFGGNSEE